MSFRAHINHEDFIQEAGHLLKRRNYYDNIGARKVVNQDYSQTTYQVATSEKRGLWIKAHPSDQQHFLKKILQSGRNRWRDGHPTGWHENTQGKVTLTTPYDARMIRLIKETPSQVVALYQVDFINKYVTIIVDPVQTAK